METTTSLFVYGTLRQGEPANYFLKKKTLIQAALTIQGYRLYTHGPYPFAIESDKPEEAIVGDLYQIDSCIFADLDRYEGVDTGLYIRKLEKSINAYIYLATNLETSGLYHIPCGDWVEYRRQNNMTSDFLEL